MGPRKVVLAAIWKKRGLTLAELAADCRKHKHGEGMGVTQVSAYLNGARPIGEIHFRILCGVLRVKPEDVYMNRYLAGGRQEPAATCPGEEGQTEAVEQPRRRLISSGSSYESEIGYSRAVVDGEWIFISGTTGFDYATMAIGDDVVTQCRRALLNIQSALADAGATLADIVRVRYILPKRDDFSACWPTLREFLGEVRPAATMIQAELLDSRMKIEVEVTARRSGITAERSDS